MKREATVILGICIASVVIGGGFFLLAGTGEGPGMQEAVSVTVLAEGTSASMTERKNYLLSSPDELASAWETAYGGGAPDMPSVDFSKQQVIVLFDGEHPTGGYSVSVASLTDTDGKRKLTVMHSMPGDTCVVTQATTSPFQFVVIPKSARTFERTDIDSVVACK